LVTAHLETAIGKTRSASLLKLNQDQDTVKCNRSRAKLRRSGKIEPGLTFRSLRHTCATLLVEVGFDIDTVRRWLGQKTLALAIHYFQAANTAERMQGVIEKFDPPVSKKRTKVSNSVRKVPNPPQAKRCK
jgi:integrase